MEPKSGQGWWCLSPLQTYDSRIWIQFEDSSTWEWDFGVPGPPPTQLFDVSTKRPLLSFNNGVIQQIMDPWIKDTVTGKNVFQLSGGYEQPSKVVRWDGQYLVAGYVSGEVLILDFHHMYPQ